MFFFVIWVKGKICRVLSFQNHYYKCMLLDLPFFKEEEELTHTFLVFSCQ